jgi:predicted nucleic acid-binding protein
LIDSDRTIDHLNRTPEAFALFASLGGDELFISSITYLEAFQGTLRDDHPASAAAILDRFVLAVPVLDVTTAVARRCASLRDDIRRRGRRIDSRAFDLLIAATALEHGLTLVTRNVRDYVDIPDLELYALT